MKALFESKRQELERERQGQTMTQRLSSAASRTEGYSLVELLISLVLMTLLLGGLYVVLFGSQATFDAQQDAMALMQEARVAVDNMAIEIRMAGADIGSAPEALADATPNRFAFVADIDNGSNLLPCGAGFEGAVDGGAERITYRFQTGQLLRNIDCWDGAAWTNEYTDQIMANNLLATSPIFQYFDDAGAELVPGAGGLTAAQRAAVRVVSITLALDDAEDQVISESLVGFRVLTRVKLRNFDS